MKTAVCEREGMVIEQFKHGIPPCPNFITPGDGHYTCVICLGVEHVRSGLEGAGCVHCDDFFLRQLRSQLTLFMSEESQAAEPRGPSSAHAEAARSFVT